MTLPEDFVGSLEKPEPLPSSDVEKILKALKSKKGTPDAKDYLEPQDRVRINEGPFQNLDGTVDEIFPAKRQVRVIVTILGRASPVDLEYWQVEKI